MSKNTVRDTQFDVVRLRGQVGKVDGVKTFVTNLPGNMFWNAVKGGGALTFTATLDAKVLPYFSKLAAEGVESVRFAKELSPEMLAATKGRKNTLELALNGVSKADDFEFDLGEDDTAREIVRTVPAEGDRPAYTVARVYTAIEIDSATSAAVMTFSVSDAIAALKAGADLTHVEAFAWAATPPAAVTTVTAPADTL